MEQNINNTPNINEDTNLENQIEALLFYKGDPVKISELSKLLRVSEEEIRNSVLKLKENLSNRGIKLTEKEDFITLVTSSEAASLINQIRKDELKKDLSKSALETLSIIIYRGPVKRSDIDYIRGVNSQFILRLLLVRGLIEKITNPKDERGYLYKASFDLLNMLGINSIKQVPEFDTINTEIENFINTKNLDENEE